MTDWNNLTTVKKGDSGERFVDTFLMENGYISYTAAFSGPHPFDRICFLNLTANPVKPFGKSFIAEIKTKEERRYYADTGIDVRFDKKYSQMEEIHQQPVFLFFVDKNAKAVYGNYLSELHIPCFVKSDKRKGDKIITYPRIESYANSSIIYFPTAKMIHLFDLSEGQCAKLKAHTTKAIAYRQ